VFQHPHYRVTYFILHGCDIANLAPQGFLNENDVGRIYTFIQQKFCPHVFFIYILAINIFIVWHVSGEEGKTTPSRLDAHDTKESLGIAQMSINLAKDLVLLPWKGGNGIDRDQLARSALGGGLFLLDLL